MLLKNRTEITYRCKTAQLAHLRDAVTATLQKLKRTRQTKVADKIGGTLIGETLYLFVQQRTTHVHFGSKLLFIKSRIGQMSFNHLHGSLKKSIVNFIAQQGLLAWAD